MADNICPKCFFRNKPAATAKSVWTSRPPASSTRSRPCSTTMLGTPKVLMASGKPIYAGDGSFLGYRGACSDITEQIEAAVADRMPDQ